MSEFAYSSVFKELTKLTQLRFDAASKMHKQLFDNAIFTRFLNWDLPQIGLTFEELIGKYNITIAAPTIGDSSKESVLPSEGLQTLSEKLLTHAVTLPMTIQDYRKVLAIQDSRAISEEQAKQQLIELMWGNVQTPVNSVLAKLDLIFLGALFNEGRFTFDETTNPEGGVRGTISYNQPTENIATSTIAWSDDNVKTVDCFEDIFGVIEAAQDKVTFDRILCAPALISYMCRSAKIKQLIHGTDKSSRLVQIGDLNEYMESNGLPKFETLRRQCRVQNGTQLSTVNAVSQTNMVFVPAGKLGVVKNAYANSELRQEPGVTYSNYGRIRVSQWGVGETQGSNGVEFTKAEATALPVITEMGGIYTLKTQR